MVAQRIVSFLPSATELLYEFGVDDKLFGVTHECKYPEGAKLKPQVISSVINSDDLSSNEINTITCTLLNEGKNIFELNKENLIDANPDLIISQETCEVCAAYTNQVKSALEILPNKPELYSMDPHNLKEIIQSVTKLGQILNKEKKSVEIVNSLERRIQHIQNSEKKLIPKVLAIEWIEPFFTAGHWIPQMIEFAGGINLISKTGEHSRRMDMDEVVNSKPDIIIFMPCGFDTDRTVQEYESILHNNPGWNSLQAVKNNQIYAVDANSFFSKPSIRTINGLEILAKIIQPEKFKNLIVPDNSFSKIS
uniref:Periplasmic binding protein (ABC.FEV.S) n=1 Tax=uncultured marine thaumarchaeote KM3_84_A09 TaxID=1456310 RepID=A0A075HSB9_9ARCH|nr:periplasmic binding protein (ABC.FEV.S) [uncultured marine thaumarchaeote KM3_84_A09]